MQNSRNRNSLFIACVAFLLALATNVANAQYAAPRIFFTDLPSAPTSGGQNNLGAFITIYGEGFGSTQGSSSVTIGGVAVARYVQWSDAKLVIQPGNAVINGNLVVNVGGVLSNPVSFTARGGHIYFVSTYGSDYQRGSYNKPWRTILKAKNTMSSGDITYVMNGVVQASDSNNAALSINSGGTSPKAIIAYPKARVVIGSSSGPSYGITSGYSNWILSGLIIQGAVEAINLSGVSNWRIVGNDISCPNGQGTGACVAISSSQNLRMLGNNIHNAGNPAAASRANYHSVSFSGVHALSLGWNTVANTGGCRAVSFSGGTTNQYGLDIHDNLIYNTPCDAIRVHGADPSQGAVQVYNNVVYRAGNACVSVAGSGLGTAQVLNNTFYDCGSAMTPDSGGLAASTPTAVLNNLFYLSSSENYLTPNTSTAWLSGSNNGFYGGTGTFAPSQSALEADPLFVNPAGLDFHLQSASPAIDAGTNSGVPTDYDGVPRPQGTRYDLGAFEYSGPAASGTAQVTQTPSAISFGSVTLGGSSTQSVMVANTGTASATISQMTVSGTGFSANGLSLPMTLAPGQTTSYAVTFAPQVAGSDTGSVFLTLGTSGTTLAATSSSSVQLSGTAVQPVGTLSASAASLSFGNVTAGSSSSQTVTFTASGATVNISQASVTGTGFTVSGPTLPVAVAAGQSVAFTVKFAPTAAGTASGTLSISSDASNTPNNVSLSGNGTTLAGTLAASPTSLSFGSITVGATSTQTVTVTASTASVTISQANVSGAGFSVGGLTLPMTLTAGQSASFSVRFAPTTAGGTTGTVSLVSNASNSPATVSLTGTGVNPVGSLAASPTSLSFGTVYTGSSSTQNVTVTASTASVTISQANATGAGFSVSGLTLPATVAAGQSLSFTVKFAPTAAGIVSGSVSLVSNAANTPTTIAVSGTGATPSGTLAASPTSLSFGSVTVGASTSQTVTVTASTASVTISQANVTGAGFSVSGLILPATVAAGQNLSFTVKFAPTTTGSITGSVSLVSNASNTPTGIALSGTGITPVHSATLTWAASVSAGVAGYNVYRGTVSGGPYTKLTTSKISAASYTDTTVAAGTTYYYVVTAVDSSGMESSYSNQATAVIPVP